MNTYFGTLFTFIIKATFTGQWLFQGSHFFKPTKMIFFQDFSKFLQQMSRHFFIIIKVTSKFFWIKICNLKELHLSKIWSFLHTPK